MIHRLAPLCILPVLVASVQAAGQVRVNPGALDALSAAPAPQTNSPAPAPAPTRPAARPSHPAHRPDAAHHPSKAAGPSAPAKPVPAPKPAPVTLAPAPPPVASLAPPPPIPPPHPLPPPVIPMVTDASGEASPIPGGLRITFGPGKADLNASTAAALHSLGQTIAASPTAEINVFAYAAGPPDDPSTPRRLSLSRALAARAVLMAEAVPSARIYLRALGNTPSPGPPDRVDLQQVGAAPPVAP